MARYKLTFTDSETGITYLLDDNIPDYNSAISAALDFVDDVDKAEENGSTSVKTKLSDAERIRVSNAGFRIVMYFSGKQKCDYVSYYGFTITKTGE